ncbi:ionotropic glutamate receptor, metazoa, Periplasmic binding protein-like I [Artemisia annua]|uniref:Glutamate receptor n=1 Tax=Artemisia annua TaxID=35608 RepID=A0A2U1N5X4_ARTAN|nr:ionotropic glutamate receptor, metazoa, Periplasmic binding protein-like I [Artemisia annua]
MRSGSTFFTKQKVERKQVVLRFSVFRQPLKGTLHGTSLKQGFKALIQPIIGYKITSLYPATDHKPRHVVLRGPLSLCSPPLVLLLVVIGGGSLIRMMVDSGCADWNCSIDSDLNWGKLVIVVMVFLRVCYDVLDLLNNIKVQSIIGPETYLEAKLLAPIANKAKVPIFSFAGSSSLNNPYLFQIKEDESIMVKSIVALVKSFKWRSMIYLYEDTDCELEILSYIHESFEGERTWNIDEISLPALATDNQIICDLQKVITSHTTVIILHMSSSLASRVFSIAKRLGMVSEEHSWIITYKTIDILQSEDKENIESLQGVIGLRPYIPSSTKLLNLTTRWYNHCYIKYPTLASREVSVLAVWAYDTIWVLAGSVQRLVHHFSLGVPQISSMILKEVSKTILKGVSGEFRLTDGMLVSNGFKIVKVIGTRESTIIPRRRMLQMTGDKVLKVGVLTQKRFSYFVDAYYDKEKNITIATGYSVDVFNTCIHALPYELPYQLIPFSNNETYDDLVNKVFAKEIDAILGDSTILANRSQYVDFTMPYTDLGIGMLVKMSHNDFWIFLKPFTVDLWLKTAAFAIFTGFVIFAIEAMDQGFQRLSAHQLGETFWFILMALFFVQRKEQASKLARFVEVVWLFFFLLIITSYTATLSSMLTVEQFGLPSFEIRISNLHFQDERMRPYSSYEQYAQALSRGGKHGGADAIIDEIPYIKMFLGRFSADYAMIASKPSTSGFGFIFQKGSPLATEMSSQIAKLREDGTMELLEKKWFENQSLSSQDPSKTLNFGRFFGLFVISGISLVAALMTRIICLLIAKLEIQSIIHFVTPRNLMATLWYLLRRN